METTLCLPRDLQVAVEEIARRTGRDRTAVLVDAVRDYVDRQEQPRLQSIGVVEETPAQSDEIEERLAANWRPEEDRGLNNNGDTAAPPGESREETTQGLAEERPARRLHSLGFVAREVGLQAKDIDAYLAANWRPDADWREEPES